MSGLIEIEKIQNLYTKENNTEEDETLKKFFQFQKEREYFRALYYLEDKLLENGTNQNYCNTFLNYILDFLTDIMNDINNKKNQHKNISKTTKDKTKDNSYLKDIYFCNFYYLRNCFDKYESCLNIEQLKIIKSKKMMHNQRIININKDLKKPYNELIKKITREDKYIPITAEEIYETINNFNEQIKGELKLFYIYSYLDCNLIENNKIFDYLEEEVSYLDQFYFGGFDVFGIPIGFSKNNNLIYRYLFSIIKNKINEKFKQKKNEEKKKNAMKYVFNEFKTIFHNRKTKRLEFIKYFVFIFVNVILDVHDSIIYTFNFNDIPLYFQCLCNQFLDKDIINVNNLEIFENKTKQKIVKKKNETVVIIEGNKTTLNDEDYSINSFINVFNNNTWISNINIIKNKSQRLLCKKKVYDEFFDEYINLLKFICKSNIAKKMQSLHSKFQKYKPFYENDEILNDLFQNRIKFYPFERSGLYAITDKYLLEIYLSSIYLFNNNDSTNEIYKEQPIILIFFNMSFNCVVFQHEGLNHYVRAYLFYTSDNGKISINTNKSGDYYPIQKLNEIKNPPKYLMKFTKILSNEELNELKEVSNTDYIKYLKYPEKDNDDDVIMADEDDNKNNNVNNSNDNDEGYFYERQLFTLNHESKLTDINFLQGIMILDPDAYNLDPVNFHYCFLRLKEYYNYKILKENFNSPLLQALLNKIDFSNIDEIKKMSFHAKRSSNNGMSMEIERNVCDVMPAYIRKARNKKY